MRVVYKYYGDLFTLSRPPISLDHIEHIEDRLTNMICDFLQSPYTKEEVEFALKGIHPGKSLSFDGLSMMFYNKFWDLVGDEVCIMVVHSLNHGGVLDSINLTNVLLILKVKKLKKMKDLPPISLCNVSCKIISKTLANRLKTFLTGIIDDS